MRYELAHDSIARQVLRKADGEQRARRRVRELLVRGLERYEARGVLLTQDDLLEIQPHRKAIAFAQKTQALIQRSEAAILARQRRRRRTVIAVISALSIFLLFALWQWYRSMRSERAQQQINLALQADKAYKEGYPDLAQSYAIQAQYSGNDAVTDATIKRVMEDLRDNLYQQTIAAIDSITAFGFFDAQRYFLADRNGQLQFCQPGTPTCQQLDFAQPILMAQGSGQGSHLAVATPVGLHFLSAQGQKLAHYPTQRPLAGLQAFTTRSEVLAYTTDSLWLFSPDGKKVSGVGLPAALKKAEIYPNESESDILLSFPDRALLIYTDLLKAGFLVAKDSLVSPHQDIQLLKSDIRSLKTIVQEDTATYVYDRLSHRDTISNIYTYRYLNQQLKNFPNIRSWAFGAPTAEHPNALLITEEGEIHVWAAYWKDLDDRPRTVMDYTINPLSGIFFAGYSHADEHILIGRDDGKADLHQVFYIEQADGTQRTSLSRIAELPTQLHAAAFSPKNEYLLTHDGQQKLHLWRIAGAND